MSSAFFCFCFFRYLFIWLHWVLVVAHGLQRRGLPSCGTRAPQCTGVVALRHLGSQFPDQGSNPRPPALEGRLLTTGPPGKSQQMSSVDRICEGVKKHSSGFKKYIYFPSFYLFSLIPSEEIEFDLPSEKNNSAIIFIDYKI